MEKTGCGSAAAGGGTTLEKLAAFKQYFGHSGFRPGQEELVDHSRIQI